MYKLPMWFLLTLWNWELPLLPCGHRSLGFQLNLPLWHQLVRMGNLRVTGREGDMRYSWGSLLQPGKGRSLGSLLSLCWQERAIVFSTVLLRAGSYRPKVVCLPRLFPTPLVRERWPFWDLFSSVPIVVSECQFFPHCLQYMKQKENPGTH